MCRKINYKCRNHRCAKFAYFEWEKPFCSDYWAARMNPRNRLETDTALHLRCLTHDSELKDQTQEPWMWCRDCRHLSYMTPDANKENIPPVESPPQSPRVVVTRQPVEELERLDEDNQRIVFNPIEERREPVDTEADAGNVDPLPGPSSPPDLNERGTQVPEPIPSIVVHDHDEDVGLEGSLSFSQPDSPREEIEDIEDRPHRSSISSASSHSSEDNDRPRKKRRIDNSD